jgi:O-antigen/teichoic acid export membrane protein
MPRSSRLARNIGMAGVQVLVSAVMLFALYYFLIRSLGPGKLGVWSLVLAATSAARFSELGISGGVIKFVAADLALGKASQAASVVQTAALSMAAILLALLPAFYPVARRLLSYFLPEAHLADAYLILPFTFLSLGVTIIGSVFLSALDGSQRADQRSVIVIGAAALHLTLTLALVPTYGLVGLAYAQVAQSAAQLLFGWVILRRALPALPLLPYRWDGAVFRKMFLYGVNFQLVSVLQLLFDPTTKALLSRFGGVELVGLFEMANKMVMQFRALVVAGGQVMVPVVAGTQASLPDERRRVYQTFSGVTSYVALPLFAGIVAVAPAVSAVWLGSLEHDFVVFVVLLCAGWLGNTLASAAYFSNLGTGRLRWNTRSHLLIGVLNGSLGAGLGIVFGGRGVVVGFVTSLLIGSFVIIGWYHHENGILLRDLDLRSHLALVASSGGAIVAAWTSFRLLAIHVSPAAMLAVTFIVVAVVIAPAFWRHPLRTVLIR